MSICLSMIVKNVSHHIERCLNSVKDHIDYWVISDTGSTDNSEELIKKCLKGIPGELIHNAWEDYGTNRNYALFPALKKADYVLVLDADHELILEDKNALKNLTAPVYTIKQIRYKNNFSYDNIRIVRSDVNPVWTGVLHEYLGVAGNAHTLLSGVHILDHDDGKRFLDNDKFKKDVEIFKKALIKEPKNERYVYYLAQSLRDSGQPKEAIETYKKRVEMGGWPEEVWSAQYECGKTKEAIGEDPTKDYLSAFQLRPNRAEPLAMLAKYHRQRNEFALGYMYSKFGLTIPYPKSDSLFIEDFVYNWTLGDEFGVCAYYMGMFNEGKTVLTRLLELGRVPAEHINRLENNLQMYEDKLN